MTSLAYMSKKDTKFDFDDILIEFEDKSSISSRSEIDPYCEDSPFLPIITAPMDTVIDESNQSTFFKNKIRTCLPRGQKSDFLYGFESYSLNDFEKEYINETQSFNKRWILIDIANGHMAKLISVTKLAKKKYGDSLYLMVGNVGTPGAYVNLSNAGADAIRVGVGNGNGCLTTKQTGGGYPMASLIYECYIRSLTLDTAALIIADGGMKDYEDIIKALALGANYVMVGSIFNKALDSAGPTYFMGIKINQHNRLAKWLHNKNLPLKKKFRGMSTKEVQRSWGNTKLKTSEGVVRTRNVEYTIEQWTDNFIHYLKSIMSYTDSRNLSDFIGNANFNLISENARRRFNK